jgi:UV excision repair protein RAD23
MNSTLTFKIKKLDGTMFLYSAEPEDLIENLRKRLAEKLNVEKNRTKLCFQGKILKDESTIESYGVQTNSYIVVIVSKQ